MARAESYSPNANPCAQCGEPIAMPESIEPGAGRTAYLWHCRSCDYRFEAVAIFDEKDMEQQALAA